MNFNMSVLLIEDDPLVAQTLRVALEGCGYDVYVAVSCSEAREKWMERDLDVVISDYRLEDGFGTDLLRLMRASERWEPTIFLSAESDYISSEEARELQIGRVLTKPVGIEELSEAVSVLAGGHAVKNRCSDENKKREGKFLVLDGPVSLDADFMEVVEREAKHVDWLALSLENTMHVEGAVLESLMRISERLRSRGGRFALVEMSAWIEGALMGQADDYEMEIVEKRRDLRWLGRKLNSVNERASVLRSVVTE